MYVLETHTLLSSIFRTLCQCCLMVNLGHVLMLNSVSVYVCPITVYVSPYLFFAGPSSPLQPSNLMSTDVRHNRAIIQWAVSRIAYTPETYTVHFGTSPGSLTSFSQQRHSGNNFTGANLQFSIQLTGLSAGTTYYYQVVAVNSVGSTVSVEQSFTTTELRKLYLHSVKSYSVWCYNTHLKHVSIYMQSWSS